MTLLARWPALAAGPAAVLLLARVYLWSGHHLLLDDAFISFRYARNLARGLGLVFNPDERVEGYTNFLWTVVLAGFCRLGLDPRVMAGILAAVAALATLLLIALLCRRLASDPSRAPLQALGATLLFAAMGVQGRFVLSGMETPAFVCLTTLALYLALAGSSPLVTGVVLALATLTRPEGVVFLGVVLLHHLLPAVPAEGRRERLLAVARLAAGFLLLFVPYFWWRYRFYGYPLPNTFYVKVDGFSDALLSRGWSLLRATVRSASLEPPLAAALIGIWANRRSRAHWLLCGFVAASLAYFVAVGGDFSFFFGPRFLLPALPPLFVLAMEGVASLARPIAARSGKATVAGLLFLALLGNALWFSRPARVAQLRDVALLGRCWTELGKWLGSHTPPDATLALGAVGMIPYYSERYTIDMLGLTDLHIAHLPTPLGRGIPGHEKHDDVYVLNRRPDYVIFARLTPAGQPFLVDWPQIRERFNSEYALVAVAKAVEGDRDPWVLETSELTEDLLDRGYRAAVYKRRESGGEPDSR